MKRARPIVILMAEDDADDRLLAQEALEESRVLNQLRVVEDGKELMEYLHREGRYADTDSYPYPGLVLLDLNMPRMDGREALKEMKRDPRLKRIPVVVLTTSKSEEDLVRSYDLGASSYISKPVTFAGLVDVMKSLGRYWIEIVDLPPEAQRGSA